MHLTFRKWFSVNAILFALMVLAVIISANVGSERVTISDAIGGDMRARTIVILARLPRVILAAFVGMALASAGGSFQALLRNPLADPFILGVSGGAALGSVVAVGLGLPFVWVSFTAFTGAIVAAVVIFVVGGKGWRLEPATLLLTGVVFNAFCFALILFVNAIVTMEQAYQIIFLLIGNLETTDFTTLAWVGAFVITGFVVICTFSGSMNLLSVGDEEAKSMGVNTKRVRGIVFAAASFMVGAAVAVSGLIGFIGLFIPHIVRLIFGADNRLLIPASGFAGAAFLVVADTVARTVLMKTGYATELPVGVITALVGAPLFMVLLRRSTIV